MDGPMRKIECFYEDWRSQGNISRNLERRHNYRDEVYKSWCNIIIFSREMGMGLIGGASWRGKIGMERHWEEQVLHLHLLDRVLQQDDLVREGGEDGQEVVHLFLCYNVTRTME